MKHNAREIYEAAQAYRHAPITDQHLVLEAYNFMVETIWNAAIEEAIQMQRLSGGMGIISSLKIHL